MRALPITAAAIVAISPSIALAGAAPRMTETGLTERWLAPDVVVVLDPSLDDLGPGAADSVMNAMQTWYANVVGIPRITFEHASERRGSVYDGNSVVSAAPIAIQGHETDLAVTTTYASDETGSILEADIVFNTRYAFADTPAPASSCHQVFDIGAVATHESGHFFGLSEDYVDPLATMYVTTAPCDAHKRDLTADDTASISVLYKPPDSLTAQCDAAPAPRSTSALLVVIVLGFSGLVRRARRTCRTYHGESP